MLRLRRILAGIRRIAIVLAVILALPAFYAFCFWLFLGETPPMKVYVFLARAWAPMSWRRRSAGSSWALRAGTMQAEALSGALWVAFAAVS